MTPPNRKMAAPQHTPYAHPNSHIGRLPKFNSPEKQSGYMMSATRTAITVQLNYVRASDSSKARSPPVIVQLKRNTTRKREEKRDKKRNEMKRKNINNMNRIRI